MKKITYSDLVKIFGDYNARDDIDSYAEPMSAVIVFDPIASGWRKKADGSSYSEKECSYKVKSNEWGWDFSKIGRCRSGSCLDGTDSYVRLDYYPDWKVDYCYLL